MKHKVGILTFPGTNCEYDLQYALEKYYNCHVEFIWHTNSFAPKHDLYCLPGGFSYGDYIRGGILSASSISIRSLKEAVSKKKKVLGICNGFQILTESGLLPGVLLGNHTSKHICKWVELVPSSFFEITKSKNFFLPISHSEGNYYCVDADYQKLQDNGNIILSYKDNINGSKGKIAGIKDSTNCIFGMMPHPERSFGLAMDIANSNKQYGKIVFDKIFNIL